MRVVFDTNVLISACLKPRGLEAQVIALAVDRKIMLFCSAAVWLEYRDVFARAKFAGIHEQSGRLLADLEAIAHPVFPERLISESTDDDDNRFLECAEAARAHYLITGNLRHFPTEWIDTKVANARGFLDAFRCIIKA